jgi:hypothetical protein
MIKKDDEQSQSPQSGTSRRNFLKAGTAAAGAAFLSAAAKIPLVSAADQKEEVQYLFVQNAKGASMDKEKLTLKDVSPTVIFFADRPERIAGHMTIEDFVLDWQEDNSKNSFKADPPNAVLSIFDKDEVEDVVVELKNPQLKNNDLVYQIDVLEDDKPLPAGPVSLFIDPIGRPLSPISIAGVHRRHRRRHRRHRRHRVR